MNDGKTVFAQLFEFLPLHEFRKCVRRYRGDYKVLSFSCLDQFLCMAFAQLTFRESLRDIETCRGPFAPSCTTWASGEGSPGTRWPTPTRTATGESTPTSPRY